MCVDDQMKMTNRKQLVNGIMKAHVRRLHSRGNREREGYLFSGKTFP
jgi:hypothetical protein